MDNSEIIISEQNLDFYNKLDKSQFNKKQLSQIEIGFKRGLDISWYAIPYFTYSQMFEIRIALQNNLSEEQLTYLCNNSFDNEQMREIRLGMIHNLDYSIYSAKDFTGFQMRLIRIDLENAEE